MKRMKFHLLHLLSVDVSRSGVKYNTIISFVRHNLSELFE